MRLVSATIHGYKRFAEPSTLRVDGNITALVGPNEVGKTSILRALAHTNNTEPFAASELSRGADIDENAPPVVLRFLLEAQDIEALSEIPGTAELRWYTLSKARDGATTFKLSPPVRRDVSGRVQLAKDLRRAAPHRALRELLDESDSDFGRAAMITLADALEAADQEDLPEDLLESLEQWATHLRGDIPENAPKYILAIPSALSERATSEREDRPTVAIGRVLQSRRPRFLLFGDAARSLENSYELSEIEEPSTALLNLAGLAELDLSELASALRDERRGEVHGLRDQANLRLREYFEEHWKQTGLAVELMVSGTDLELYVRETNGNYWQLDERSDGLRWFVALVAYLHSQSVEAPPILLVDEAEQHLHYDGQADLVRAFERQEAVADVIYTTHSAGCLPQDLGTGVRVIARREEAGSEIRNSLWSDDDLRDGAGFSNLLMQMGASTFAFAATRRAVICEGITEVALLPTLLRQATSADTLPFQFVPGLANVAGNSVVHLDMAAARVAFLVDSDAAGRAIAKKLRRASVPESRILRLGPPASTRTLEDLVAPTALRAAVNAELERSSISVQIPLTALRATPRSRAVSRWCHAQRPQLKAPGKLAIAQQLLTLARQGQLIVNPSSVSEITALNDRIMEILD